MERDDPLDENRLPWLEPVVEEDDYDDRASTLRMIIGIAVGLIVLGLVVGGIFWAGTRGEGREDDLIAAPAGDYKVKPDDPGGMEVEGEGDTAFAASEGDEPESRLNMNAVPEAPVTTQPQAQATSSPPAPSTAPAQPKQDASAPAKAAAPAGATIQLGAFSSQGSANEAWRGLSGRFGYLSPLSHNVIPVQSGGRTLYRLRASGPGAAGICRRLSIAGENCVVVE